MNVVGVMARAPVEGKCKTRLAATLGMERATRLYRAMLLDTLAAIEPAFDARLVLMAAPEDDGVEVLRALAPPRWEVIAQRGADLGERLADALVTLAGASHDPVALVDSDSPTARWDEAGAAFAKLQRDAARALIGPCEDGGYWLIAAARPDVRIFEGIAWSTRDVSTQTRERCRVAGLALEDLRIAYDVDDARDVERLRADPDVTRRAPRTAAELAT